MKNYTHVTLSLALLATGCAEWPRSSNLPDTSGQVPATDVRELVQTTWSRLAEDGDFPFPSRVATPTAPGTGAIVEGVLDGTGWNDNADARVVESAVCDGASRAIVFGIDGDWTGDVDGFAITVDEPVRLCADLSGPDAETGWDLVLIELDECGLPSRTVFGADGALGLGLGGVAGGWTALVEPGTYQLGFAAYDPIDSEMVVPYTLAVSAVVAEEDGQAATLCPLPPEESAQ